MKLCFNVLLFHDWNKRHFKEIYDPVLVIITIIILFFLDFQININTLLMAQSQDIVCICR